MKKELTLPYAEIYEIKFSQVIRSKSSLRKAVVLYLTENHPGFNEESLWDYAVIKKNRKQTVYAVVLERNYFIQEKSVQKNLKFFIHTKEGKVLYLFRHRDFTETGKRRKISVVFVTSLILLLLAVTGILAVHNGIKNRKKIINEKLPEKEREEENPEIKEAVNIFDLINNLSQIITKNGGRGEVVQMIVGNSLKITFSLYGCSPYEVIHEISLDSKIEKCSCSQVMYKDGREYFELEIEEVLPALKIRQTDIKDILYMQEKLFGELSEGALTVVSAGIDENDGRVTFSLTSSLNELKDANQTVNEVLYNNGFFLLKFTERPAGEKDLFFIDFDAVMLVPEQFISKSITEEALSVLFGFEAEQAEEEKANENTAKTLKDKELPYDSFEKIGTVKKDGKELVYYRTREGKIVIKGDAR